MGIYTRLLRQPHVARLVGSSTLGRLKDPGVPLALLLLVHAQGGSFARAGLLIGVYTVASGICGPPTGRLIDRRGHRAPLAVTATIYTAAIAGIAIVGTRGGTVLWLALLAGAVQPPLASTQRALWSRLLPAGDLRRSAYALDGVLLEIVYSLGPMATAAIVVLGGEEAALLALAAATALGTLGFVTAPLPAGAAAPAASVRVAGDAARRSPLRNAGVRTLLLRSFAAGTAFGLLEVAVPAFATLHGAHAAGGVALAAMAVGSGLCGIWYGGRTWRLAAHRRLHLLAVATTAGIAALTLAPSVPLLVVLLFAAGATLAPLTITVYELVNELVAVVALTEAYAWLSSVKVAGGALGAPLAGVATDAVGARGAFAAAAAAALVAALVDVAGRASLTERAADAELGRG